MGPRHRRMQALALLALLALLPLFGAGCGSESAAPPGGGAGEADATARGADTLGRAAVDGGLDTQLDTQHGATTDTQADASTDASAGPTCPITVTPSPGVVPTTAGAVAGVSDGATWSYRGVPYAAPPLGPLRWRPPQPHACWTGAKDAKTFGPKCPQLSAKGALEGQEDCLHLNVWTPKQAAPQGGWPVLFFIHGGGNIQGSAAQTLPGGEPIYSGRRLAEGGAVVITVQYRLGALGWLAISELEAEGHAANHALRDLLAALGWVQANAAAFGADPARVMIFGESAGAVNVCALLGVPTAKGLFSAALMQSGGCTQGPVKARRASQDQLAAKGSCGSAKDRLACLRALPVAQLLAEFPGQINVYEAGLGSSDKKHGPVVDGDLLPLSTDKALAAGTALKVPFVVGANAEEVDTLPLKVADDTALHAHIDGVFGWLGAKHTAALKGAYTAAAFGTAQDALLALYSDMRFICPARAIARAAAKGGNPAVYRYHFAQRAKTKQGELSAKHGRELLYVFGTMSDIALFKPHADDLAVGAAMQAWWRQLAAEGQPGSAAGVAWPVYDAAKDRTLLIDTPIQVIEGVRSATCDVWDGIVGG